jgi:hypothetical protein
MPRVGLELKIPVFEWEKTVRALDRAATVIGFVKFISDKHPLGNINIVLILCRWEENYLIFSSAKFLEFC